MLLLLAGMVSRTAPFQYLQAAALISPAVPPATTANLPDETAVHIFTIAVQLTQQLRDMIANSMELFFRTPDALPGARGLPASFSMPLAPMSVKRKSAGVEKTLLPANNSWRKIQPMRLGTFSQTRSR